MEKVLKLYKYVDGVNDTPFPSEEKQVVTSSFRYDIKRMGGAPTISCTIMHELCLDKLWSDNVYASFNGERFFIKQHPSSSFSNTDTRFHHEIELVSERIVLDNVYFYDVVDSGSSNDKPVSNSSRFSFFGDIMEFAERLNQSLRYSNIGYSVVVDNGISSDEKQISFEDQFFSNVLQEIYNTYNLPYYFSDKVIHIGYTSNVITQTFKYGQDESLLSINKQNANFKIVNRVTGVGSSDNIPYYYPNDYESKSEVESNGGTWINPQSSLMPSIYRESLGRERFYSAKNNTYVNDETGSYYFFSNPYVNGKPKEHIVNFTEIKPTIKDVRNSSGRRIDMFVDFDYDANDNDEMDNEGNYIHPYFFAKLRKMDGRYGFNLFDQAIDSGEMTISMTSGSCASCQFVIGVDESTNKNTVQLDENGNLLRDENGNVKFGDPQDNQNDTSTNEVWIALRKDIDTFGIVMPNVSSRYKPSINDTFVILNINLPKAYILAAEKKLEDSLVKYMAMNNDEKFNFSISFSRIYFAEHPEVLEQLDENSRIQIEYNNDVYELYVSSYSYYMSNDNILPEVKVELSDTLTISQNALQNAIDSVKQDILFNLGGGDFLKQGLRHFLRKDINDRSRGVIASNKGFEVGKYKEGELGTGGIFKVGKNGETYFEVDNALFRKVAQFIEVVIKKLSYVGGSIILSPASMKCSKVEEFDLYYRCYFTNEHNGKAINQEFVVGDQARTQTFNIKEGVFEGVSNRYYWRLVVGVGDNYIDLSKTDCDVNSSIPQEGDDIVLFGNRSISKRQNAIILSSYGEGTPSFRQYRGIKSYNINDAELVTEFSPDNNIITGNFISQSGKNIEDWISEVEVNWDRVLEQTDKEFTMWFFEYDPSPEVYPESEWFTYELRALHEQDLFYNTKKGLAWRYTLKDGVFFWDLVTDADTLKALEDAAKAQQTADGAVQRLDSIVSDGKLSAVEKKEVRKEWASIVDTYEWNMYSSDKIGVDMQSQEVIDYSNAYNALSAYITPLLAEYGDSDINPDEYRGYWTDYYTTETKLRNFLSEKAKEKADDVEQEVNDMSSDGVLSALEKKEVLKEWMSVAEEYAINIENALKYEADSTSYTDAYMMLGTYMNNGQTWDGTSLPLWLQDLSTNQSLENPDAYRSLWVGYYNTKVALLDEISNIIKEKADNAQKDADEITDRFDTIVSDSILSTLEKKEVLKEWLSIVEEYRSNVETAQNFGMTTEDSSLNEYINAYNALGSYMDGDEDELDDDKWDGSRLPSWLADLSTNQAIVGDVYRSRWTAYYDTERVLLSRISVIAKDKADDAQKDADKANDELGEIASDNVLSKVEKKETLREWMEEFDAYYANLDNAEKYDVDTTDYEEKFYALAYYLNGNEQWDGDSIPLWLRDLTANQEITGSVFRQKWSDYYNAKVSLLDAISTAIKAKADEAQQGVDDVNDRVDDIVSDGVLSSLEKKEVLKEWQSVVAQYAINKNDADKYDLDYSDYTDAYYALGTYLNNGTAWTGSGTPLWLGTQIGVNTTLSSPTEYRKVWVDYYKAESILRERISEAGLGTRVKNFKTYPNELPVPPYNVGDRWMNAYYTVGNVIYAENDDMVCVQAKAKNEVASIRDWEFSSGMNSDTKKDIEASIKNLGDSIELEVSEREGAISGLQLTIDGIRTLVGDAQDAADSAYSRANSAYTRANDAYSHADYAYQIADALGTKVDNNATAIAQNSNYISLWAGNFNEQGEVITESGLVIGSTFTNLYSRLGDNVSYRASIASDLSGNFYFGTSGIVGSTGSLKYFTSGKKYKLYIEPNNASSLYLYYYDGSTGSHMASLIGLTEYTINSFNASKGNYMYVIMYGSTTSIDIRIVEVTGSSNNEVETDIITYTIPSKYHYVGYNSFDSFSKPLRKFNRGNKVNITIGSNDAYTLKLYYWNGSTRTQIASLIGLSEYVIESFNDLNGDYLVFEITGNTSSFTITINDAVEAGLATSVQYDPKTGKITSNVKISGDNIDLSGTTTINGSFSVDTDGTTHIGGFTVSDGKLTSDGEYKLTIDPVSSYPNISISLEDQTYAIMRVSSISPYSGQLELYGAMGAISLLNGGFAKFENSSGTEGITIEGDSKLGPSLKISKGTYYISIGINSENMAVIGSNCWPYYDDDTTRKSGVLSWDNSRYGKFK